MPKKFYQIGLNYSILMKGSIGFCCFIMKTPYPETDVIKLHLSIGDKIS
jgi:hypothetical protein